MAVDLPAPLFRTRAIVAVYDDPLLVGQPRLKLGFLGLLGGFDLLAVRGLPELGCRRTTAGTRGGVPRVRGHRRGETVVV